MLTLRTLLLVAIIASATLLGTVYAWVDAAPRTGELVRERYPNRSVKLERHIIQDEKQNFVNHGPWTMWDSTGNMVAKGNYQSGQRHGEWKRWYFGDAPQEEGAAQASATDLSDALDTEDFAGFKRPFVSSAVFADDKISSPWALADADGKPMFTVDLDKNVLHGKAVWWHSTGKKSREIDFRAGVIEGEWKEWDAAGKQTRSDRFLDGSRLAEATTTYDSGAKAAEGVYLHSKENVKVDLDWWTGLISLSTTGSEGKSLKQGRWEFWYENGELKCEGEFLDDKPVGLHVWWFANGQKQCEGGYADGQPEGVWTHWHENGLRAAQGEYKEGKRVGQWSQWDGEGKAMHTAATSAPTVTTTRVTHTVSTPATMRAASPQATRTPSNTVRNVQSPSGNSCTTCKTSIPAQGRPAATPAPSRAPTPAQQAPNPPMTATRTK